MFTTGKTYVNIFLKKVLQLFFAVARWPQMNKELAKKIKALKPAIGFSVVGDTSREEVLRTAKAMKDLGIIAFDVVTRDDHNGGFKVRAL